MSKSVYVDVKQLKLDLKNYRTVPQRDEVGATEAMILISPDYFWGLMDSLLDTGYLPTENVIVIETAEGLVVREGNRRVAALKLIHGYMQSQDIRLPSSIKERIDNLLAEWTASNLMIPCVVYPLEDSNTVDRIVRLAHGKGDSASRDQWKAVARARHNRDVNHENEPTLDLLEKYLREGKNITSQQAERWAGTYPLSVLEEAAKKLATRLGTENISDLAAKYPSISYRESFEGIMNDIGLSIIHFKTIRNTDFATKYGLPAAGGGAAGGGAAGGGAAGGGAAGGGKIAAVAINDPRGVKRALRQLKIMGNNREKVVTLRKEAVELNLVKNPIAFCLLLRSLFEISAKAYCIDHSGTSGAPSYKKQNGQDKELAELSRDVYNHLTSNGANRALERELHGSIFELTKKEGLLSVTSMNQLIHNPKFSMLAQDISSVFGNILPLLKAMNS